jgi:hypothetical protein
MVDDSFAIPSHGLESITLPAKQVKSFIFTKKMRQACKRVANVLNEWDKANQTRQERIRHTPIFSLQLIHLINSMAAFGDAGGIFGQPSP